jgi:hypothetical protein
MAEVKQDVILSFNADTGGVDKQVEQLTKAVEELAGAVDVMGSEFKQNTEALDASLEQTGKQAKQTAKEVGEVGKSAKKGGAFFKEFGALGQEAIGPLDDLTGGLASKFTGAFGGVKKLASGMKVLKLAIAGTGIGALVIALGAVGTALAQNEGFVKKLQKSMLWMEPLFTLLKESITGFGNAIIDAFSKPGEFIEDAKQAVIGFADAIKDFVLERIDLLLSGLGSLGSAVSKLFSGDFKGALKDAGEGFLNVNRAVNPLVMGTELLVDGVGKVIEATGEWVESTQPLVDALDALDNATKQNAKDQELLTFQSQMSALANQELKRSIDDTNLSFQDRLMIAQKVADEEQRLADAQVNLAQQAVNNAQEQIRLRGESEENLQRLRDAQLALAQAQAKSRDVEAQNLAVITNLQQQEQEIQEARIKAEQDTAQAILKAQQDLEDELFLLNQNAEDREVTQAMQAYDRRVALAGDDEGLLRMATEQLNKELADINTKYRNAEEKANADANAKRLADEDATQGQLRELRDNAIQAFADLNEAFGGISVQQERERAEREQAIQDEKTANGIRLLELESAVANEKDAEKRAQLEAQLVEEKYASELRVYNLELENYERNRELDKQVKKQFEIQKAVAIAQTAIAQGESAVQAYKSLVGIPVVGPGLAIGASASAIALGAKQIQAIRRQTYQSTAGEAPTPPQRPQGTGGAGGGTEAQTIPGAPQLDLSFLGEGATQTGPIQAYVIAEDVSTAQQATQKIEDQATL